MTRILVIEDNIELSGALTEALELEGYEVQGVHDGAEGLDEALRGESDLVILDLMLPGLDGYRVLRALRDKGVETPVLILTARAEEEDKLRGFRLGADDYLTKPFGVRELLARVNVLLRRRRSDASAARPTAIASTASPAIHFGDVELHKDARIVRRGGEALSLRPKELDLLIALVERAGRVVSRHELLKEVWGYDSGVTTRTVDVHVFELRRKLEADPGSPRHIVTVWKAGYRFDG